MDFISDGVCIGSEEGTRRVAASFGEEMKLGSSHA